MYQTAPAPQSADGWLPELGAVAPAIFAKPLLVIGAGARANRIRRRFTPSTNRASDGHLRRECGNLPADSARRFSGIQVRACGLPSWLLFVRNRDNQQWPISIAKRQRRKAGSAAAHGAEEIPSPQREGKAFVACVCASFNHKRLLRSEGSHHVLHHTIRQTTRQSSKARGSLFPMPASCPIRPDCS